MVYYTVWILYYISKYFSFSFCVMYYSCIMNEILVIYGQGQAGANAKAWKKISKYSVTEL